MRLSPLVFCSLLGLSLLFSCKNDLPPEDLTFPPAKANFAFYLDSYMDSVLEADRIPGLAVGVVKDNRIAWNTGYGLANVAEGIPVDLRTRFMMGEAADVVVTVAVLQMLAEKGYTLNTDINTLLPQPIRHAHFPQAVINVRMLLSHTSGFQDEDVLLASLYGAGDASQRLRDFVGDYFRPSGAYYSLDNFSADRPGKTFAYARVNMALAAYLVEAVTGIEFDLYCKTRMFSQLGYSSVSWFFNDLQPEKIAVPYLLQGSSFAAQPFYGYPMYPSGQLRISLEYLSRFMLALLQNGAYGDQHLISGDMVRHIQEIQYPFASGEQALGWRYESLDGRNLLGMRGSDAGVSTRFFLEPDRAQGVILLANATLPDSVLDDIMIKVLETSDAL
ncbi:MAG: class C beta-lactamase-related serine hydrolase [Bacteroidetes bacterium]|nr:MAG: class C beta-lactamase-related serine hydrolase [Bacteroidota bacterium]